MESDALDITGTSPLAVGTNKEIIHFIFENGNVTLCYIMRKTKNNGDVLHDQHTNENLRNVEVRIF